MINTKIFGATAFVYLFSSMLYLCYFFFRQKRLGRAATLTAGCGVLLQTAAYGIRWIEGYNQGFTQTPFSFFTLYETLIFASWSMAITYLFIEYQYRSRALGAIILPIISLLAVYASLAPGVAGEVKALPSVLRGNFFAYHVVSCTVSYAAFGIACVAGIPLLSMLRKRIVLPKRLLGSLPTADTMDDLSYKCIAIGFVLFTIGMATGVYRTKVIWGSYWNWDPVETTGLITWLLYALILHGRYQRWWGMKATAMLSVFAFIASVICFLIAGSYMMVSGHYPIL